MFTGLRSSKDYDKRPGRVVGLCEKSHLGTRYLRGQCVLGEWTVGVGGSDGYLREQGVPVGNQECIEGFHRGCIDYLGRQFVPKWDSPNGEDELVTARTVSLFA